MTTTKGGKKSRIVFREKTYSQSHTGSYKSKVGKGYYDTMNSSVLRVPEDSVLFAHDVAKDFLLLTAYTSPYPHDSEWFRGYLDGQGLLSESLEVEGNFVLFVGEDYRTHQTLFVAHIDTADYGEPTKVNHVYYDGIISTDTNSVLGADDKAGVAVLMHMIRNKVPGTYMFVKGEERGRVGSIRMARDGWGKGFQRAIQFDRFGTDSIVTHQMGEQSCSDEFAEALAASLNNEHAEFNFKPDDGGLYTDTYSFHDTVPECTNISVGYMNHHTSYEVQDLVFLVELADACVRVAWHELPTIQSVHDRGDLWHMGPSDTYGSYYSGKSYDSYDEWYDEDKYFPSSSKYSNAPWADDDDDAGYVLKEEIYMQADVDAVQWSDVFRLADDYPIAAADMLYSTLRSLYKLRKKVGK